MDALQIKQVASHTWVYPYDTDAQNEQANIGIIYSGHHTLLLDTGNGLKQARRLLGDLNTLAFPRPEVAIYTHHHWDHTYGTGVFNPRHIIAHETCRTALEPLEQYSRSSSHHADDSTRISLTAAQKARLDQTIAEWRGFRLYLPVITFSHQLAIYLDDLQIEVVHVGGHHAADSVVIYIPADGVVFMGDCFYPPPLAQRTIGNNHLDLGLLGRILRDGYDVYIDGHGAPRTRNQLEAFINSQNTQ